MSGANIVQWQAFEYTQEHPLFLPFIHNPAKRTYKPEWLCCDMQDYVTAALHTQTQQKHRNSTLKSTVETSLNSSTVLDSALHWLTALSNQRRLLVHMSKTARHHCSINGILCLALIFAASQPISFWAGAQLCAAMWGRLLFLFSGMALCSVMKGKVISIHITLCGILAMWEKTYPQT